MSSAHPEPNIFMHTTDTVRRMLIMKLKLGQKNENGYVRAHIVKKRTCNDMEFDAMLENAMQAKMPLIPYMEVTTGNPLTLPTARSQRHRVRKLIRQSVVWAKESYTQQHHHTFTGNDSASSSVGSSDARQESVDTKLPTVNDLSTSRPFHLSSLLCTLRLHLHMHSGITSYVPMSHHVSSAMLCSPLAAFSANSAAQDDDSIVITSDIEEWRQMCSRMKIPQKVPNEDNRFWYRLYAAGTSFPGHSGASVLEIPYRRLIQQNDRTFQCAGIQLFASLSKGKSLVSVHEKLEWLSNLMEIQGIDLAFVTDVLGMTIIYPEFTKCIYEKATVIVITTPFTTSFLKILKALYIIHSAWLPHFSKQI